MGILNQLIIIYLKDYNPMKYLVTGNAEFVGSSIVNKLLELGNFVHGVDNFITGYKQNVDKRVKFKYY